MVAVILSTRRKKGLMKVSLPNRRCTECNNPPIDGNVPTSYHRLRGSASSVSTATGFVNGKGQFSIPYRIDTS